MAAGMPTSEMVEVEFVAGTFTDVSADVELQEGLTISSFGRSTEYGTTQSRVLTLTLDNHLGKYTPNRQTLADGVTTHPYYPNVIPRKRIRYSYFVGATKYIRFVGYIKSWPPAMEGNILGKVTITASDRFDQLSRITLQPPLMTEILLDNPYSLFPLTDAAGTTLTTDVISGATMTIAQSGAGGPLTFGDNGPGFGEGTGLKFAPATVANGQYLQGAPSLSGSFSSGDGPEIWVQCLSAPASTTAFWSAEDDSIGVGLSLEINSAGKVVLERSGPGATSITSSGSITDGGWHMVGCHESALLGTTTYELFVDAVSQGTTTGSGGTGYYRMSVGQQSLSTKASALFTGNVGFLAWLSGNPIGGGLSPWSAGRMGARYAAGRGYYGDTTDQRIARWLTRGGLAPADMNLDTGIAIVNTYPQSGKTIVDACQDMALTEAGGSAVYVAPDGRVRFPNRQFRKAAAPVMTLDALLDLDGSVYAPAFDDQTLINTSTGSRASESGTQTMQTDTNATSVLAYGTATDSFTSYSISDGDVLRVAQWRTANNATPSFRLKQVQVDLSLAVNSLYVALTSVEIGSRIRLTNLPVTAAPTTQVDLIVEGWTETVTDESYVIQFDASPADNPPAMILDDTSYGRLQCSGQSLNTTITSSGTTVVIASASTPTFTTVSARYPLLIQIGQEVIKLNTAPGGASSPQTFTGVSRAQQGTTAAAQTAGSVINLWPAATLAL